MRLLRNIFAACMVIAAAISSQAQINTLPVKTVNGQPYHYYVVQPKETIYSLSRSLGIDRKEIERYNPSVADGLRAGQTLYFPATAASGPSIHIVKEKETPYGISKKYGITTSQLMTWNPEARDGIRPGQKLIVSEPMDGASAQTEVDFGQPAANVPEPQDGNTYTIKQGETLFGIATKFDTTVDAILALNPSLDRNNYQAGEVIKVPDSQEEVAQVSPQPMRPQLPANAEPVKVPVYRVDETTEPIPATVPLVDTKEEYLMDQLPGSTTYLRYDVKKNETFYSIARAHNLTVEDLEKANPTVGILKEGMVLNIPMEKEPEPAVVTAAENGETNVGEGNWMGIWNETTDTAVIATPASVDIALILPLMLNNDSRSKQAQLYTEFYKGFLIAVDSMRRCGSPINIQVYDTEDSAAKLETILSTPALAQAEVIVAPDSEAHLERIGEWAKTHDVKVLNLFVVKDESYLSNPMMMQGNIPHTDMYIKAINGMVNRFSRFTPVIITRKDGPDDKAEYVKALKSTLESLNVPYKEIEYDMTLRASDLEELPLSGKYAFIPTSGRQAELNRIAPTLIEFSRSLTDPDPVRLFGYPEWTTFRGETLVNMHALNTLVYSRFYTVPEDPSVREIEDAFVRWYGAPMANFVPRQGLFGFDTGMYLINALKNGKEELSGKPYLGVQNGFDFIKAGAGGWVNDELYFINFRPSGLIDKISL